jgi:gas vesicle protein
MALEHDDAAGYLGWFLLGAVAGAAAALLMTPRTGRETREMLAEHGGEFLKKAQEAAGTAQSRAGEALDRGRDYVHDRSDRFRSAWEAGRAAMREEMGKREPDI